MNLSPFPWDSSYSEANYVEASAWQRDADIADEEHRHGLSLQEWQDRLAEQTGDQQRENDL